MEKIHQGDTPEDQFTGEDLGAAMAAAEGFDHSRQVADRGQRVRLQATGLFGTIDVISKDQSGWSYLVKLDSGQVYGWFHGDELFQVA